MDLVRNSLRYLGSAVHSPSAGVDPETTLDDLKDIISRGIPDSELGPVISALLTQSSGPDVDEPTENILSFLRSRAAAGSPKARESALEVLDELVKMGRRHCIPFAQQIYDTCVLIFRTDKSSPVRTVALAPITRLLERDLLKLKDPRVLIKMYVVFSSQELGFSVFIVCFV
jgi:hypothetical protein